MCLIISILLRPINYSIVDYFTTKESIKVACLILSCSVCTQQYNKYKSCFAHFVLCYVFVPKERCFVSICTLCN